MSDFDLEHAKHCADRTGIWRDACNEIERLRADLLASQEREADLENKLVSLEAYYGHGSVTMKAHMNTVDHFQEQLAASQLEVEALREALIGYGQHDDDCAWNSEKIKDGATDCSCGLSKALSAPPSPDALAAHDREVEAKALRKAAEEFHNVSITASDGSSNFPREIVVSALRRMAAEREPKP